MSLGGNTFPIDYRPLRATATINVAIYTFVAVDTSYDHNLKEKVVLSIQSLRGTPLFSTLYCIIVASVHTKLYFTIKSAYYCNNIQREELT